MCIVFCKLILILYKDNENFVERVINVFIINIGVVLVLFVILCGLCDFNL